LCTDGQEWSTGWNADGDSAHDGDGLSLRKHHGCADYPLAGYTWTIAYGGNEGASGNRVGGGDGCDGHAGDEDHRAGYGRDGLASVRTENGSAHVQDWSWHCRFSLCAHDGERGFVDGNGGTDHSDGRALPVADVNAGFVDDDHGAADGFEDNAAGGRTWWCVSGD
jgi:hypothetical protein